MRFEEGWWPVTVVGRAPNPDPDHDPGPNPHPNPNPNPNQVSRAPSGGALDVRSAREELTGLDLPQISPRSP